MKNEANGSLKRALSIIGTCAIIIGCLYESGLLQWLTGWHSTSVPGAALPAGVGSVSLRPHVGTWAQAGASLVLCAAGYIFSCFVRAEVWAALSGASDAS